MFDYFLEFEKFLIEVMGLHPLDLYSKEENEDQLGEIYGGEG